MAHIVNKTEALSIPPLRRLQAEPLDSTAYFGPETIEGVEYTGFELARNYATDSGIAYVGQILSVNEGTVSAPNIKLYKIADTAGTLKPIYDADNISTAPIDSVGFKGELPAAGDSITPKAGYQYVLTRDITNGTTPIAQSGDYMVFKPVGGSPITIPADNGWTPAVLSDWVILEQNLVGAITNINVVGNGDYVVSVRRNAQISSQIDVVMGTLPTPPEPPIPSITKQYGKLNSQDYHDIINIQGDYAEYSLHGDKDNPNSDFDASVLDKLPFSKVESRTANSWFSVKLNGVELEAATVFDGEDYSTIDCDYTVKKLTKGEYVVVFSKELTSILSEDDLIAVTYPCFAINQ